MATGVGTFGISNRQEGTYHHTHHTTNSTPPSPHCTTPPPHSPHTTRKFQTISPLILISTCKDSHVQRFAFTAMSDIVKQITHWQIKHCETFHEREILPLSNNANMSDICPIWVLWRISQMDGELRARERDTLKYAFYLHRSAPLISAQVVACLDCSEDFRVKISGRTESIKVFYYTTTTCTLCTSF